MNRLAILGASGHGKVVADTALQVGWSEVVFFDDAWPRLTTNGAYPVSGNTDSLLRTSDFNGAVVAIGNNQLRLEKSLQLLEAGFNLPALIHPRAYVAGDVVVEDGTVVFAGSVVQPGSTLGKAVIVNTGATVDHDCTIAAGAHIAPGAHLAGGVIIGKYTWVGIGASINQYLTIGEGVTIGAGAAVISDLPDGLTVVGVPATVINKN